MAFNNTRTILLHGPRGMEWYCPTPPRLPGGKEELFHRRVHRERVWASLSFSSSEPATLGECAFPGWEKCWSWSYIEACTSDNRRNRQFLRRNPQGELLLHEYLLGRTYRVLTNALDGVYPAQPNADFPEAYCSRPMMSLHYDTKHNDKGQAIEHYFVAYKLPNGAPQLPREVAATKHALQKRDGTWCLLPKTETQVPESWQPKPSAATNGSKESGAQKPVKVLVESTPAVVKDVLKGSLAVMTTTLDACAKALIKLWGSGRSALKSEPDKTIQEPQGQKPSENRQPTTATIPKLDDDSTPASKTNSRDFGNYPITNLPNYPIGEAPTRTTQSSRWSWTAIQMNDAGKTLHCLRCSPEGKLLLKRKLNWTDRGAA